MLVEDAEVRGLEIELRQQAHYWRALHGRATEREAAWKDKAQRLKQVVRQQQARSTELTHKLEEALARVAWLEGQVFGRKSEQCPKPDATQHDSTPAVDVRVDAADAPEPCGKPRRKRGKQPGAKGYGRRRRHDLPAEDVVHDLPEDQRQCSRCGKPFEIFPGTEDSETGLRRSNGKSAYDVALTSGPATFPRVIARQCQALSPHPVHRS